LVLVQEMVQFLIIMLLEQDQYDKFQIFYVFYNSYSKKTLYERGRRRKARMANENVVFDLPKIISLNSPSSSSSSRHNISSERVADTTENKNADEKIVTDTETVKIEVMEEDDGVTILGEDDGIKIEHLSEDEDDQPLTEALAKEMES
jgi:hypothetical protein